MMILPHPGAGLANERNVTLNGEPCRRSRLKRSGSGEPVNAYEKICLLDRGYMRLFKGVIKL